jgi:hypothetical protein
VHFIPMHATINAEGAALLFLKEVWKHHRMLQVVISAEGHSSLSDSCMNSISS